MPDMDECIQQKSLKKSGDVGTQKRKPCKCGSKTHSRPTHLDCPLNKRNRVTDPSSESQAPPPSSKSQKRKASSKSKALPPSSESQVSPPSSKSKKRKASSKSRAPPPSSESQVPPPSSKSKKRKASTKSKAPPPSSESQVPPPSSKSQKRKASSKSKDEFRPKIGENVFAAWKRQQFYLAQVTHIDDEKYTVYFVEDSCVKKNLTLKQLRPVPKTCRTAVPRALPVQQNSEFHYGGDGVMTAGRWQVRSIGPDNTYVCVPLSKGPNVPNTDNFDIGFVLDQIRKARESRRERGPGDNTSSF